MSLVCSGGEGVVEAVPEGGGVGEVMHYLRIHSGNEKGVELGLTALITLSSKQGTMMSIVDTLEQTNGGREVACC